MSVPDQVRERVTATLWADADRVGWLKLSSVEKARRYEFWTKDPQIGGVLSRYIESSQVRVYIKDTLLKPYSRYRLSDVARPMRLGGFDSSQIIETFIKPHSVLLSTQQLVAWGRADDWKSILMALHERRFGLPGSSAAAAVLFQTSRRFGDESTRAVVEDAARRLAVAKLIWDE